MFYYEWKRRKDLRVSHNDDQSYARHEALQINEFLSDMLTQAKTLIFYEENTVVSIDAHRE